MLISHCSVLSLVFITCLLLTRFQPASLEVICVKPNHNTHCDCKNATKCGVLLHFVQNVESSFASDVIMELMPGTHILESNGPVKREQISNFTMTGQADSVLLSSEGQPEPTARIKCQGSHQSGFYFANSSLIRIEKLSIEGCGLVFVNKSTTLVTAALALDNVTDVTVIGVRIANSRGFGLHADRVFGNVLVVDSVFYNNTGNDHYYGGNAQFWYGKCFYYPSYRNTSVIIKTSWFMNGSDSAKSKKHNLFYPNATGLNVHIGCPRIIVNITNITAIHNRADSGGNIAISLNFTQGSYSAVYFSDSYVAHGFSHRGGGLKVWSLTPNTTSHYTAHQTNSSAFQQSLLLSNIYFYNNTAESSGGALYLSHYETRCSDCPMRTIMVDNCMFKDNKVLASGNGAVMQILKHKLPGFAPIINNFEIIFCQCVFIANKIILDERNTTHGSTVEVISSDKITFQNCNFTDNNITALSARNSNLIFKGKILFDSNRGINGGALKFCDTSFMYLENNTVVQFVNNSASNAGGAIYAQQRCLESAPPCFFQPIAEDYTSLSSINHTMRIEFWNNSANFAGDVLYGGAVEYCFSYDLLVFNSTPSYYHSYHIFETLFNYSSQEGSSKISSDPYGVCLCDSNRTNATYDCHNKTLVLGPKYPGEQFTILAVTIGQRDGFAPAPIDPIIMDNDNGNSNIMAIRSPKPAKHCVALTYYIHTAKPEVKFNLTAQQSNPDSGSFYFAFNPPQITVKFRNCSWGFKLSPDTKYCKCHPNLLPYVHSHNVRCFINTHSIRREGSMWVGFNYKTFRNTKLFVKSCENETTIACQDVIVSLICPYDYCLIDKTYVSVNSTDKQCDLGRTGILCGACAEGHSVSFGGSSCLPCTWYNLLILPLIIILGVLLVVILTVLNLTVTEGTINGLIFYANIIQVNRAIYFPGRKTPQLLQAFASVISWLNLDLGVTTCFYLGMDTYAKVWFQFLFPVYIWLIVVAIVLLSRRYAFFSRLSGENAVKVLATLFLLSMAKLGRNVIAVFAHIPLELPNGTIDRVWLPDGNVAYFSGKHILLYIVALCFTLLIVAFIAVLTFVQWLQKCSWRCFFWVNKLKPLFDAYTGPYKDHFRFWTGFLLAVRATLFGFYAASNVLNTQAKLVVTVVASSVIFILAWIFGGVYKKKQLDILEATFIFNIGTLSVIMSYIEGLDVDKQHGYSYIAFGVSAGVALLTFLGVIIYHVYKYTKICYAFKACYRTVRRCFRKQRKEMVLIAGENEPLITHTEVPTPIISPVDRESLPTEQRYRFD